MAALVWIRFMVLPSTVTLRFSALMMPSVEVTPRLLGLPTAMAVSPMAMVSESPRTAGVRPVASILMTAMSLWESAPTRVAL